MEDMKPLSTDASCWIKGVFHKNDGYLAPLVLNPKRTKGNIDINIENHLAKSRLMSSELRYAGEYIRSKHPRNTSKRFLSGEWYDRQLCQNEGKRDVRPLA